MAQTTIDNPDFHRERKADDRGRVYLGKKFADEKVRVVVEFVDDD